MRIIKAFIISVTIILVLLSFILFPDTANAADMELSTSQGLAGSTLSIRGSGFTGKMAFIYWDDKLIVENVPISEQGNLEHQLVIPYASKGEHEIYIEDDSNWSGSTALSSFTIVPGITIFPKVGAKNSQITITGSGFDSNEKGVGIIWDGDIQSAINLMADNRGTWNTIFTVPNVTKGEHYFSAFGSITNSDEIEEIAFIVTPWSKIEPISGPTGTKINILLLGLQTSEFGIKLTWDEKSIKSNLTANAEGELTVTINAPECAAGKHSIGVQRRISTASGKFSDVYFDITPNIKLQPTTDETSTTILLTGTGFAKEEPLVISLNETVINRDISTDNTGSFSAVLQIPETDITDNVITVEDQSGNSKQAGLAAEKQTQLTTPQLIAPKQGHKIVMIDSIADAFLKGPKYLLGKQIELPPVTLVWSKLETIGDINYILQIAADNDFSAPVLAKKITTGHEYTLPDDVNLSTGNYNWRVKAVSGNGIESPWSEAHELEIILMPTQVLIMSSAVMVLLIALIVLIIWRICITVRRKNYYW